MEIFSLLTQEMYKPEIHAVLEIPELKIVKLSDTRWLAHEKCVCTVKKCYIAIVAALEEIYEDSHEPEAYGISKS